MQTLSCVLYIQKTSPQPISGFPLFTKFQECASMNLKFYKGNILLYMINHTTRLSVTVILLFKKPDQIVSTIMKY